MHACMHVICIDLGLKGALIEVLSGLSICYMVTCSRRVVRLRYMATNILPLRKGDLGFGSHVKVHALGFRVWGVGFRV